MGIFSVLGLTLALFLKQGLATWRTADGQRETYEEAQAVITRLRDDLQAVFATIPATGGTGGPRAQLLCDADELGRQRLVLTRTFPAEARHPLASLAGTELHADREIDGRRDRTEGLERRLRATGGLMEVLYAMDPEKDGLLLRGVRAPAGGPSSLFTQEVVARKERLRAAAIPFSTRVIALELRFWGPTTNTWDLTRPPLRTPQPQQKSGPLVSWDSTRALLPPPPGARDEELHLFKAADSFDDPEDDVLPERVRVTIALREDGPAATWTILREPLPENGHEVRVQNAAPFETKARLVRLGTGANAEWVQVRSVDTSANVLRLEKDGRGRWGTKARKHDAGTDVVTGVVFTSEIALPGGVEPWSE